MWHSHYTSFRFHRLSSWGNIWFLQRKCKNALQKAVLAMNNEADIQHNKLLKLDNTIVMYQIYNADTLEKLINTVHEIHNVTSSHEKLFAGEHNPAIFRLLYTDALGIQQYAFNSLLFLRVVQDKYISLYRELITQLRSYVSAIRILMNGYLSTTLIIPSKLQGILAEVKTSLQHTNPDYTLVLERLHLYYDMQLVTFGIDREYESCGSVPGIYTTIHPKTISSLPIRNCPSSNTGLQHRSPILHPPACQQTLPCLKFRNIHITYTSRAEVM